MFNFNINWLKIIKENIPVAAHSPRRMDWITALISPFNKIHQEFLAHYQVFIYKIGFTGQVMYLEKILNDKFSPVSGGIYIDNGYLVTKNYLYKKSELQTPIYLYRNWNSSINYVVNDYAVENNKVYRCLVPNVHNIPSLNPTKWVYYKEVTFLRRAVEFNITYNFIVKVPASIGYFDVVQMQGLIDYYKFAGKRYKIEIY